MIILRYNRLYALIWTYKIQPQNGAIWTNLTKVYRILNTSTIRNPDGRAIKIWHVECFVSVGLAAKSGYLKVMLHNV